MPVLSVLSATWYKRNHVTTLFLRVSCWRQLADNVAASLSRGDRALVYGRLRQRSFETSEGERRVTYEIDADAVGAELTWHAAHSERLARRPAVAPATPVEPAGLPGAGPLMDIDASTTGALSAPEPVGAVTAGGATRLANVLVGQAPRSGPTGNGAAEELLPIGAASLASVSAGEGQHG